MSGLKGIPVRKGFISSMNFLDLGERVKIVICVRRPVFNAVLSAGESTYADSFNEAEPYDRKSHVFYIPKCYAEAGTELSFTFNFLRNYGPKCRISFTLDTIEYADEKSLISQYDSGLAEISRESEDVCRGVVYSHILYNDRTGAPVHAFLCEVNTSDASVYIGTPDDGYESVGVRATIPDMISSAVKGGKAVAAAVNADFFDIFGDFHPSGLCVKNGKVIANGDSTRPFIGVKKDGTHIITDISENPDVVPQLEQAAAGLQMVLKDGEIYDYAPLEPFSFVRHPRTCVGVKSDGNVLLLVVDGRIPEYSNGASLVDLARLMQSFGAARALNLDGGGSSAMYTEKSGEYVLHSRPADLFRPTARLIRKDYNAILIVRKP